MSPSKNLPLLMDLLYSVFNKALPNSDGSRGIYQPITNPDGSIETFCNLAVQSVANGLGYENMNGLNADSMFHHMENPVNGWIQVSADVAQAHGNDGVLVIAAWENQDGHGHVCVVCPGILDFSPSFAAKMPKVMNVGKDVFFGKRASYAFTVNTPPIFFALGSMI